MKHIILFIVAFFFFQSCSKSDTSSCKFESASFAGKKYKVSKVIRQDNNEDVTAEVIAEPCANVFLNFNSTSFTVTFGSGCTDPTQNINYTTSVVNGKNNLVTNGTASIEIEEFNCSSFRMIDNSGSVPLKVTYSSF